jgi:hypothetical protein
MKPSLSESVPGCACGRRRRPLCCLPTVSQLLERNAVPLVQAAAHSGLDLEELASMAMRALLRRSDPLGVPPGWRLTSGRTVVLPGSERACGEGISGRWSQSNFDLGRIPAPWLLGGIVLGAVRAASGALITDTERGGLIGFADGQAVLSRTDDLAAALVNDPAGWQVWLDDTNLTGRHRPYTPLCPTLRSVGPDPLGGTTLLVTADRHLVLGVSGSARWEATVSGLPELRDWVGSDSPTDAWAASVRRQLDTRFGLVADSLTLTCCALVRDLTSGGRPSLVGLAQSQEVSSSISADLPVRTVALPSTDEQAGAALLALAASTEPLPHATRSALDVVGHALQARRARLAA